jgi:hypothetical protein
MDISSIEVLEDDRSTMYRKKFFISILLQMSAIVITHRTLLKNLRNQALLILFIANFMELLIFIPRFTHSYYFGYINPVTADYCTWYCCGTRGARH